MAVREKSVISSEFLLILKADMYAARPNLNFCKMLLVAYWYPVDTSKKSMRQIGAKIGEKMGAKIGQKWPWGKFLRKLLNMAVTVKFEQKGDFYFFFL